jgi:hypothetical protein
LRAVRRVASPKVRTAERDWPRKGAKGAKGIQAVTTPQIRRFALVGVFAPLALFRGYPDFLVSTFRARRSSNRRARQCRLIVTIAFGRNRPGMPALTLGTNGCAGGFEDLRFQKKKGML